MSRGFRFSTRVAPALLISISVFLSGCFDSSDPPVTSQETALEHAEKHLDPTYVCPMHPQIIKNEEGSCPICGMDLVEKKIKPRKETAMDHAVKHLDPKYVCPMHPQIVKGEPGSCPICGMDLVEKMIDVDVGKQPTVEISSAIIQSMGVRQATVERDTLWKFIQTVGRIEYDETKLAHIHPRAEGWMESLYVRAEGDPVKRGQTLGRMYSQEILGAQVDFLIALDPKRTTRSKQRAEKARNRLRLLGVPESTIKKIEKRGEPINNVPVLAPRSGVITKLTAREGMYVTPNMEIFTISDPKKMWVQVDVYEYQIDWLALGLEAEMTVPAYPGKSWSGKVEYIYPELDMMSRTLRVRLAFDNPDGLLKANMFAEISIYGGPKKDVLVIPSEALIETGERTSVVKALGEGRFQPVDVIPGMRRNGRVEILSGLEEGEDIVISGQFLIDSESSLRASFMRMDEGN